MMDKAEYTRQWMKENRQRPSVQEARKRWQQSPKGCYAKQKAAAKHRGIEFTITFEEWWALWEPHWLERGRGRGFKCMGRYGDEGPYSADNVYIADWSENAIGLAEGG